MTHPAIVAIFIMLFVCLSGEPAGAQTGVYTLNGGTASETDQSYAATLQDQSAVYVLNAGHLILTNCTLAKAGDASDVNASSQYGVNAGVLVRSGGTVAIVGGSVTTNASGGNGLFATRSGSAVTMSGGFIHASGGGAHGVDATYGGAVALTSVDITTNGANASAIATDFGGGTVSVTGGTITAASIVANSHSAGIYSTGEIAVTGASVLSLADCGGVIDGANSISLTNTTLHGALEGIKIWKTAPMSGTATVTVRGGSVTADLGDAFHVTAETGNAATAAITVSDGAEIHAGSGVILNVLGSSTASLTLEDVSLDGRIRADNAGTATVELRDGSALTGAVNGSAITMDAASAWNVTSNSIVTSLVDPGGVSGLAITNIVGNGHDVHYDAGLPANAYLDGKTYALVNGGTLTPEYVPVEATSWGAIRSGFRSR